MGEKFLRGAELELHYLVAGISSLMEVGLEKRIGPTIYVVIMSHHS